MVPGSPRQYVYQVSKNPSPSRRNILYDWLAENCILPKRMTRQCREIKITLWQPSDDIKSKISTLGKRDILQLTANYSLMLIFTQNNLLNQSSARF